ncbi:hypothetical protein DUI87_21134 [Hirundo rustica rustica]|uniref:Uncharacterized protein n=1 Tax=Hirundo rustica rustica TaxID=333673 RepID=A0A3M0JLQ0_HIRRU|nr:hypothetical protein DUI87_21134 [Hirundo rustica rustica]
MLTNQCLQSGGSRFAYLCKILETNVSNLHFSGVGSRMGGGVGQNRDCIRPDTLTTEVSLAKTTNLTGALETHFSTPDPSHLAKWKYEVINILGPGGWAKERFPIFTQGQIVGLFGMSTGQDLGFDDPCASLDTQSILWLYDSPMGQICLFDLGIFFSYTLLKCHFIVYLGSGTDLSNKKRQHMESRIFGSKL